MKRYLVTGAASGIGLATAMCLAADTPEGCAIILVDKNAAGLDAAARSIEERGSQATPLSLDLTDDASFEAIRSAVGERLDGVASNAGVILGGTLVETGPEEFDNVFALNLRSAFLLARALHPALRDARGAYVATASILASEPCAGVGAYAMTKAALVMMVRQLSLEWAADGIRCNTVSPGSTWSRMTEASFADPARRAEREARIPLGRLGTVDDTANAIAYLLSERAAYVTGIDLRVDGGMGNALMFNSTPAVQQG